MKTIYLIRHGKPDFPGGEKMCLGITDIPLGAEGFAQAERMAKRMPPVTAVFSSPLIRAVQTANALKRPVKILPGLQEYDMGAWDGLTFREIQERYPDLYEARGNDPFLSVPGQEETAVGLCRFTAAIQEAADQSKGDIAVIAHGGVIAAFLESLGGKREKPDYTHEVVLTYDGAFYLKEEESHA